MLLDITIIFQFLTYCVKSSQHINRYVDDSASWNLDEIAMYVYIYITIMSMSRNEFTMIDTFISPLLPSLGLFENMKNIFFLISLLDFILVFTSL